MSDTERRWVVEAETERATVLDLQLVRAKTADEAREQIVDWSIFEVRLRHQNGGLEYEEVFTQSKEAAREDAFERSTEYTEALDVEAVDLAFDVSIRPEERLEDWPETFSLAGEDPSCSHMMTWDSADSRYRCLYECGRTASRPPDRSIQAQQEHNEPDDDLATDGGTDTSGNDQFLQWLEGRIEDSAESYKRDTNPRHTNISLGKVRAYKHVRSEYLERWQDTGAEHEETGRDD